MITSITVTSSRAQIIGDALRSVVDWVDMCLIVDIGIEDNTLEVAREIVGAKLQVVKWEGPVDTGNFADIRNFGLDKAWEFGADWACILDTDERIHVGGTNVQAFLDETRDGIILTPHVSGSYDKERIFKLPALDQFTGGVHECVVPNHSKQTKCPTIHFEELPKTEEQLQGKLLYLLEMLTKETEKDPKNPRWWYYLGDTLAGLGRNGEAIRAFDRCSVLRGWDEESAWACFRMAILLEGLGRKQDALDICAAGLTRHAGISELPWLAGEISLRMGLADKAIYWARIAVANSTNGGESHFIRPRIGFRYPFGAKEGPYDLMVRAYTALGMQSEADKCAVISNQIKGNI